MNHAVTPENVQAILTAHGATPPEQSQITYYPHLNNLVDVVRGSRCWASGETFVYAPAPNRYLILIQVAPASGEMAIYTKQGYHDTLTAHHFETGDLIGVLRKFMTDNLREDYDLEASQLDDRYNPDGDGEHPVLNRDDWRDAVAQQTTISGYWDWVAHHIAYAEDHDKEYQDSKLLGAALDFSVRADEATYFWHHADSDTASDDTYPSAADAWVNLAKLCIESFIAKYHSMTAADLAQISALDKIDLYEEAYEVTVSIHRPR